MGARFIYTGEAMDISRGQSIWRFHHTWAGGVLNVGGASLTFMMSRASPFAPLLSLFNIKLSDPVDIQKVIALSPTVLDRVDPSSYATHLLTDTFEGSPAERFVLQQAGIGDTSVPNLASHLHARAMKIPHLQPSPRKYRG